MHTFSILGDIFSAVWWLIPLFMIAVIIQSRWFKGVLGEALVQISAKCLLPANTYHAFHDVTLPTSDGTTQIDHIFVSSFGVFVVETKNMKGWIFGSERQSHWTQKIYKQSFKFQNPLRQNYKHVKVLETALGLTAGAIHSVVVFTGKSQFKTSMPKNVTYGGGYIKYIRSFCNPILSDAEIRLAISKIQSGRLNPSLKTNRQHVAHLKARSDTTAKK